MFKEFRDFALRGNVVDMAVGIIIGAAFGTIVKSLVSDVIMPPIGIMLGNVDFSNLFITLSGEAHPTLAAAKKAGATTLNYGAFINTVISFVIVAFCVFLLVKQMNRMKKKEEEGRRKAVGTAEAGSPAGGNPRPAEVAIQISCFLWSGRGWAAHDPGRH